MILSRETNLAHYLSADLGTSSSTVLVKFADEGLIATWPSYGTFKAGTEQAASGAVAHANGPSPLRGISAFLSEVCVSELPPLTERHVIMITVIRGADSPESPAQDG